MIFPPAYKAQELLGKTKLFQVPHDHPAAKNIGRAVRFKDPNKKGYGTIHHEVHYIQHLQLNHRGDVCYRVQTGPRCFGRVMPLNEAVFID